jgi:hypothetical protein
MGFFLALAAAVAVLGLTTLTQAVRAVQEQIAL